MLSWGSTYLYLKVAVLIQRDDNKTTVEHVETPDGSHNFKNIMFHQIYTFIAPQVEKSIIDNEETRRYITFGYYYRDTDWENEDEIYYKDTPIGFKYSTIEDFEHDPELKQLFFDNPDEFGQYMMMGPDLENNEVVLNGLFDDP